MKTQPNNKVKIFQKNNGCSIHIKFDHSLFIGDILVNFFVVVIFWLAASFAIYAVLFGSDSNAAGFLMIWLIGVSAFTYHAISHTLWLRKGSETLDLNDDKIIIIKHIPLCFLTKNYEDSTTILFENLEKMYYSEYSAPKNQLPSAAKGNLHIKSKFKKISFGISLNQQEASLVFDEISKFKYKKSESSPIL